YPVLRGGTVSCGQRQPREVAWVMIVRIRQLLRVGRFPRWDGAAARRDEARFKRLTLVYGRNASGKSTIVRTCAAAGAADGAELERDRTLDSLAPPLPSRFV